MIHITVKPFLIATLLFSILTGCANHLREEYNSFVNSRILLPDELCLIANGEVIEHDSFDEKPKLIIYIDSTECSVCKAKSVKAFDKLFDMSDSTGLFETMVILSPNKSSTNSIVEDLLFTDLSYPIYVDISQSFARNNSIPEDKRMHIFLIDKNHTPVFVGDPLLSDQLMSLFKESIDKISSDEDS